MNERFDYIDFLAHMGIQSAHPGGMPMTEAILKTLNIDSSDHVLDVGCGSGETAVYIAEKVGCKVTAIDLHPVMVERAKQTAANSNSPVNVIQANAEKLPFNDDTFTLVLAESVTVFTQIKKSLSEYFRVLTSDGHLCDLEMTVLNHLPVDEENEIKQFYSVDRLLTETEWKKELGETGFSDVQAIVGWDLVERPMNLENGSGFQFSSNLDVTAFSIWLKHIEVLEKYGGDLTYRIYKGTK